MKHTLSLFFYGRKEVSLTSNLSVFVSLEPGRLMTKYYLKFDTMKYIMQTPVNCGLEDALHTVCHAEEIACMCIYEIGLFCTAMSKVN